jgi:hypothetical protein
MEEGSIWALAKIKFRIRVAPMKTSSHLGKRIAIISALALVLLALVLIVSLGDQNQQSASDKESPAQKSLPDFVKPETKGEPKDEESMSPSTGKLSGEAMSDTTAAVDASAIESILSDAALSFEESATRLLECTRREDLPMEVRLDALDHAFNLDRWQAMTLCMEKPLAKPIAERLLSGIHNHGEAPKDQVSACMHLMLNDDPEIREQAQELLAFLVSAEEHASDPEKLREAADAFLKQTEEGDAEQGADADSE